MKDKLPTLRQLVLPSFFTIPRGVKIKTAGIRISESYNEVLVDKSLLAKYVAMMTWEHPAPFPYLYILAQRAQTALMLDRAFTIAIPGLVHLSNQLEQWQEPDFGQPFRLEVSAEVPYKEEGALIPVFEVVFLQQGVKVARCTSVYLARRKSGSSAGKKGKSQAVPPPLTNSFHQETWQIPADLGRRYARASGDINPIHTTTWVARMMGFPRRIMHGWYAAARVVKTVEKLLDQRVVSLVVDFKAPVFLPSEQALQLARVADEILFQLLDTRTRKITMTGTLKTSPL